jgi:hypothetical protein
MNGPMATIYIPLRNEGTNVWRPVQAERLDDGSYRVLGPVPSGEEWSFSPGAVVRCEQRTFQTGGERLVAIAISN